MGLAGIQTYGGILWDAGSLAGDKPARYRPPLPTPLDSGLRRNDELGGRIDEGMPRMANGWLPERSIPDRSPGRAFIAIAHAGWRRHTKV